MLLIYLWTTIFVIPIVPRPLVAATPTNMACIGYATPLSIKWQPPSHLEFLSLCYSAPEREDPHGKNLLAYQWRNHICMCICRDSFFAFCTYLHTYVHSQGKIHGEIGNETFACVFACWLVGVLLQRWHLRNMSLLHVCNLHLQIVAKTNIKCGLTEGRDLEV